MTGAACGADGHRGSPPDVPYARGDLNPQTPQTPQTPGQKPCEDAGFAQNPYPLNPANPATMRYLRVKRITYAGFDTISRPPRLRWSNAMSRSLRSLRSHLPVLRTHARESPADRRRPRDLSPALLARAPAAPPAVPASPGIRARPLRRPPGRRRCRVQPPVLASGRTRERPPLINPVRQSLRALRPART